MIAFPHAKINLGLSVVSKRPDGFHNLETIFYPIPLKDVLEIVRSDETKFHQGGFAIPEKQENNLVMKAYNLFKKNYPEVGCLDIHLHKAIPLGAGLGGGSSDAAEMLKLVNQFFNKKIPLPVLADYALQIGSDCPFFLQDSPCYATGRGEILEPVSLSLSGYSVLLVHPEIHVDTAWAFSKITPAKRDGNLKDKIILPVESWSSNIQNDFEIPVFSMYPSLQAIKEKLYAEGALYASMTGSGSTLFGIFPKGRRPDIQFDHALQSYIG
jgi:4-diphosphocytidyl-2-C-methyl-D-erythritol kinase